MSRSDPRIHRLDGMELVGMRRRMTMGAHTTPELWRAFRARLSEVRGSASEHFVSMRVYGALERRAPALHTPFHQWAAVEVAADAPVPDGMARHRIEEGTWAVFDYRGAARDVRPFARWIHDSWLPGSEWLLAEREQFEVLPPDYRPTDPDAREEIWIPVRPRRPDAG